MNGTEPLTDELPPAMKEALGWITRLTSGAATQSDAHAFEQWRAADPAHATAFREAAAFRRAVRAMELGPAPSAASNVVPLRPAARSSLMSRRAMLAGSGAIAASAAAVVVARPPLGLWPSFAELTADQRTAGGERKLLRPTDGVAVEMNARSALSMIGSDEGVSLIAGEAYVAIERMSAAFTVQVGGQRFTARAGALNVRTSDRETCITCLAGKVEHQGGGGQAVLNAGDQMIALAGAPPRIARVDVVNIASWRDGLLVFRNTPLAEAVEAINRYRDGKIIIARDVIASRPVNGIFHTDQIDNAVRQIQQLLQLQIRQLPGNVILIG